ncbi:MAG TPA: DNA-3-methyladenine glycosylase [Jiangellales bacterium]|nr:DNA-3-methyladenine glycosylase [Jiangellales bacterium]
MAPLPLPPEFYDRPVLEVARDLLGCLVRSHVDGSVVVVRLSEVEAYAGEADPGSHAWRGRTPRNAVMYGPPGRAYVYFTYGMHWCVNLVCGPPGHASAVLLRAGEVVEGVERVRSRRPGARSDRDLARGPARLARCLGVTGELDGADTTSAASPLQVLPARRSVSGADVRSGPRVGLSRAAERPWRLWTAGDPSVSPYRAHTPRRRQPTGSGTLDRDRTDDGGDPRP